MGRGEDGLGVERLESSGYSTGILKLATRLLDPLTGVAASATIRRVLKPVDLLHIADRVAPLTSNTWSYCLGRSWARRRQRRLRHYGNELFNIHAKQRLDFKCPGRNSGGDIQLEKSSPKGDETPHMREIRRKKLKHRKTNKRTTPDPVTHFFKFRICEDLPYFSWLDISEPDENRENNSVFAFQGEGLKWSIKAKKAAHFRISTKASLPYLRQADELSDASCRGWQQIGCYLNARVDQEIEFFSGKYADQRGVQLGQNQDNTLRHNRLQSLVSSSDDKIVINKRFDFDGAALAGRGGGESTSWESLVANSRFFKIPEQQYQAAWRIYSQADLKSFLGFNYEEISRSRSASLPQADGEHRVADDSIALPHRCDTRTRSTAQVLNSPLSFQRAQRDRLPAWRFGHVGAQAVYEVHKCGGRELDEGTPQGAE
eukprot:284817559_2